MGRLIALVSGGKDSILSMMLSQAHGHEVAYIANLYPEPVTANAAAAAAPANSDDEEDVDSFCFQTVGFKAIPALADALGVPLRRRAIRKGQSIATELVYDTANNNDAAAPPATTTTDEVEEMYELLKAIVDEAKAAGTPVTGVCSGAILSDYQRLRVEHVCTRLGLMSYAYLWRMPQEKVLDLVALLRVEAVLLKVASMGLNPRKHLGKDLVAMTPYLKSLAPDVHPAGEGGEFETLVLCCPLVANGGGLEMTNQRVVVVDDNPITPTGFLTCGVAQRALEARPYDEGTRLQILACVSHGALKACIALRDLTFAASGLPIAAAAANSDDDDDDEEVEAQGPKVVDAAALSAKRFPRWVAWKAAHLTADAANNNNSGDDDKQFYVVVPTEELMSTTPAVSEGSSNGPFPALYHRRGDAALSAGDQVRAIFQSLDAAQRTRVFYTMVMLPSLDAFAEINKAYVEFFGVSPPSRAVVECDALSAVTMDIYLTPTAAPRDVLHVQSISAWAAACIGPYAQANRVECAVDATAGKTRVLATAGVLGLEPGSMVFPGLDGAACPLDRAGGLSLHDRFLCEFRVCVENLRATLERMGSDLGKLTHAQVFVSKVTDEVHGGDSQRLLEALWRWVVGAEEKGAQLPPRCRVVVLSKLPRGALVEIQGIADDAWWVQPVSPGDESDNAEEVAAVGPVRRDNAFWLRPGLYQAPAATAAVC